MGLKLGSEKNLRKKAVPQKALRNLKRIGSQSSLIAIKPQVADPLPLPVRVAKTGRNHLNEEFTPLLPTGIGERF
jgi:hypothetical protein